MKLYFQANTRENNEKLRLEKLIFWHILLENIVEG